MSFQAQPVSDYRCFAGSVVSPSPIFHVFCFSVAVYNSCIGVLVHLGEYNCFKILQRFGVSILLKTATGTVSWQYCSYEEADESMAHGLPAAVCACMRTEQYRGKMETVPHYALIAGMRG